MIEFKKKYDKYLPYSKESYLNYYNDEIQNKEIKENWYGYSIQYERTDEFNLLESVQILQPILKDIIYNFGDQSSWLINHDSYYDVEWFPKYIKEPDKVPLLWNLFQENSISREFSGGIKLNTNTILNCIDDLQKYAIVLSYIGIRISNTAVPLIITLSQHASIDLYGISHPFMNEITSNYKNTEKIIVVTSSQRPFSWI